MWGPLEVTITNHTETQQELQIKCAALLADNSINLVLSKSEQHACALIETISNTLTLPESVIGGALSVILYAAMKRSWEWGYEGQIKALYKDSTQGNFFCFYAQFLAPELAPQSPQLAPQSSRNGHRSPSKAKLKKTYLAEMKKATIEPKASSIMVPNNFELEIKVKERKEAIEALKCCYPKMREFAKNSDFNKFREVAQLLHDLGVTMLEEFTK